MAELEMVGARSGEKSLEGQREGEGTQHGLTHLLAESSDTIGSPRPHQAWSGSGTCYNPPDLPASPPPPTNPHMLKKLTWHQPTIHLARCPSTLWPSFPTLS